MKLLSLSFALGAVVSAVTATPSSLDSQVGMRSVSTVKCAVDLFKEKPDLKLELPYMTEEVDIIVGGGGKASSAMASFRDGNQLSVDNIISRDLASKDPGVSFSMKRSVGFDGVVFEEEQVANEVEVMAAMRDQKSSMGLLSGLIVANLEVLSSEEFDSSLTMKQFSQEMKWMSAQLKDFAMKWGERAILNDLQPLITSRGRLGKSISGQEHHPALIW